MTPRSTSLIEGEEGKEIIIDVDGEPSIEK